MANAGPILGAGQDAQPSTLKDRSDTTTSGWAALEPRNGTILRTTRDPGSSRSEAAAGPCAAGASIADGMVFWGTGTFFGTGPKRVYGFGLP